ncbi:MAG: ROK family transcriptional regulator [Victivallales bacterium]|nr:ROK family transcriptional regulator [Victivallales bacterium]
MEKGSLLLLNDIRVRNTLAILRALLNHNGYSRVELAKAVGCDNTAVTRAIQDLMSRGLVKSAGKTEAAHGRPREKLVLSDRGGLVLGIALRPNYIMATLSDLQGMPRNQSEHSFGTDVSWDEYLSALDDIVSRMLAFCNARLAGVGISTFGPLVDKEGIIMANAANFSTQGGFDMKRHFLDKFKLTPLFADMMICKMHYELHTHPELAHGNVLLAHLGRGIGLSMSCNGGIVMSRNQHGGELGHNICEPDGLPCTCGRRGCLETRCSVRAVLKCARQEYGRSDLSIRELGRRYEDGEAIAAKVVDNALRYLAIALANQANNCFPDSLILTGDLLFLGKTFQQRLEANVRELLFDSANRAMKMIFQDGGGNEAAGATLMVVDKLLSSPDAFNQACPKLDD